MRYLKEDKLDMTNLYFHGSASERKANIQKPSYRYPFYVTTDMRYAMAFANKKYSSTGGERSITYGDNGYVYVISLNPNAEFFDFRKIESDSSVKNVIAKILTQPLFDIVYDNWKQTYQQPGNDKLTDVWEFGQSLASLVFDDKESKKNPNDGLPYVYDRSIPDEMTAAKKMSELYGIVEEGESHEVLAFIFKELDALGYSGVITTEQDFDPDEDANYYGLVDTGCAVGVWDVSAIDVMSAVPLSQRFCKKVFNADLRRHGSARQKIDEFIRLYSKIRNAGENKR